VNLVLESSSTERNVIPTENPNEPTLRHPISTDRRQLIALLAAAALVRPALALSIAEARGTLDVTWTDAARRRPLRLRLRFPASEPPWPLIVYSPGLGSGLSNDAAWCNAWCEAGLLVATVSHPQTNDQIWDARRGSVRARLNTALNGAQLGERVNDCRFVVDQWTQRADLQRLVRARHIGIAGDSQPGAT
jgi:predicted dienelactone hydrolase